MRGLAERAASGGMGLVRDGADSLPSAARGHTPSPAIAKKGGRKAHEGPVCLLVPTGRRGAVGQELRARLCGASALR
eukprot:5614506-Alexandrium_andersonii.AAC.1